VPKRTKSGKECAQEMVKKGGDYARAIRYATGYGAGKALKNPKAIAQVLARDTRK